MEKNVVIPPGQDDLEQKYLFLNMFYLGGIGLAIFLNLLLLSKRKKSTADKILAAWLLLITIHLLLFYFARMAIYPQLLGVDMPLPLIHGPFLYLYTLVLTNRSISLTASLLHFIPALAVIAYVTPFLTLPVEQKIFVYQNNGAGYEAFNQIKSLVIIVSGVSYVILSSLALRRHRFSIADQFSYTEKINLQWLQYLIYWIGVIWIFVIFGNDDWVFGAAVLFIVFIGFFGIRQAGIFHSPEVLSPENKEEATFRNTDEVEATTAEGSPLLTGAEKRKYQKSGLSTEGSEMLHSRLATIMSHEKLYRESELSLAELAGRLNTQPNYLSQVINEREGKNFYDYINTLRVEEFKRVASGPDNRRYTLLGLAQHCGFNSKSTFNRYFKKVTGQSPSEFMVAVPESEK